MLALWRAGQAGLEPPCRRQPPLQQQGISASEEPRKKPPRQALRERTPRRRRALPRPLSPFSGLLPLLPRPPTLLLRAGPAGLRPYLTSLEPMPLQPAALASAAQVAALAVPAAGVPCAMPAVSTPS